MYPRKSSAQLHLTKQSSPACARAVKEVTQRLEAAGHEVVLFQPPNRKPEAADRD